MKGLIRTLSRGSAPAGVLKQAIRVNAPISVDGATGIGFGTVAIEGFPAGNLLLLGVVSYLQFTKLAAATGIIDAFTGSFSIGSAPTVDAVLSGTDADIIASTVLGAATAGVSPSVRAVNAVQAILDNTDSTIEINLNLLIDDLSISANAQGLTVTGVVYISFMVLGDD